MEIVDCLFVLVFCFTEKSIFIEDLLNAIYARRIYIG